MDFWTEFSRTLMWRPRQALVGLYWHLTGRRVRARNRMRANYHEAPHFYAIWIETIERGSTQVAAARQAVAQWPSTPRISMILPWAGELQSSRLAEAVGSVEVQILSPFEAIAVLPEGVAVPPALDRPFVRIVRGPSANAAEALQTAIAAASGDWALPMSAGSLPSASAVYRFAEAALIDPGACAFFADHDHVDDNGLRSRPWLKPLWNAEMALSQDYISQSCIVAMAKLREALPLAAELAAAPIYALMLRVGRSGGARIVHVPHILARVPLDTAPADQSARLAAIAEAVAPLGGTAEADRHGLVRVIWPLPADPPLVSIIVPTRDKVELLRKCLDSLYGLTTWPAYEVLVMDNGSVEPATLSYFDALKRRANLRILPWDRPYNYSEINNAAARAARGSHLCLLNNDTEVIDGRWLELLMRQAVRPEVGAVGARLLYADGSIQHAGVVIGMGNAAGHAHRFQKPDDRGYFHQADVTRFVSAVTAACLVVEKRKFEKVGGLDEENLAIAYNDVDFCLKLQDAGWRNVYVPHAVLTHHESLSRGDDLSAEHRARYFRELAVLQERWDTIRCCDPLFHPRLDRACETYTICLQG